MRTGKDCFKASGRLRAALLTPSALALAWALPATPARAQDATWLASPGTNVYGVGANWDTGTVPTGTAYFGATNTNNLWMSSAVTMGGWTFNAGAPNYTFENSGELNFTGAGITVNGGSVAIANELFLNFYNASTASSAAIVNVGVSAFTTFHDASSAGTASITNHVGLFFEDSSTAGSASILSDGGLFQFFNTSSAGTATITNSGGLYFFDNSTAAGASITASGAVYFLNSSTAGNAAITTNYALYFGNNSTAGTSAITNNVGGLVDFSTKTGLNGDHKVSAGSIAGAGSYNLGANELTVGSNNISTEVSGIIAGTGGSLVKTGTGTLKLSGSNTFSGGVTLSAGTLGLANNNALGTGMLTTYGGTVAYADGVTIGNAVDLRGSTTFDIAAGSATQAGAIGQTGGAFGIVKTGTGTLTLSGNNAFTGGVTLNAGTLRLANNNALGANVLTTYGGTVAYADGVSIGNAIDLRGSTTLDVATGSATQAGAIGETGGSFGIVKTGAGTLILSGASTYTGGTTINAGTLQLGSSSGVGSIVGTVTIGAGGTFDVVNAGTSGITGIANSGTTNFRNASTAGIANITNSGTLNFNDTSTAGSATITNSAAGNVYFNNSSSAGSATIISDNNFLYFNDTSTAGSANITNSANSRAIFQGNATANTATITNSAYLYFYGSSTASNAVITNNEWLSFNDTGTAGSATLTNNRWLYFYNTSTAGSATITNADLLVFRDNSTAGNASITNSNTIDFVVGSTAGSAVITNNAGGTTTFQDNSTAGNAQLINNAANAVFDFSGSSGPNGDHKLSAGSIAGNGTFYLGANALTVGGNNLSTTVSGVIADGGASGGTGGSLVKTGTGTLTLAGTNTYTGGTTFAGGTVSVSSDANLGDLAGGLTFKGGTLQIAGTAFNATTRTVNLGAGGGTFDIADAANNFVISQSISGSTLTKSGAGTLTLSGAASFSGAMVSAGTLMFDGNATAGNAAITNNAQLVFATSATAGDATITNTNQLTFYGNTTAGNAVINNSGNVLFDGNSTPGSAQLINTASSAVINFFTPGPNSDGKLTAGSIAGNGRFDLNGVELTVGSNNLSTNVTGVLTGDGSITGISLIKVGTGKLTLSGVNTYTGATAVDGGTLAVNGSIAASSGITVNSDAILGGTGIVGNTTIASGGALAPGNSIGTLTVSGNLAFAAGSFYTVEISTTAADRTNVSGTATLTGATVQALAIPGSFRGQTFTLLNASGGLGGTQFAGLTIAGSFSPARNPRLSYDLNNVYLVLDPGKIELPAGTSGNQTGVAGGINNAVESGATPPAGFDTLLNMSGAQLNRALSEVSGQPGAASTQAAFNAMQQFLDMLDPVGGGMDGERGMNGSTLGYATTTQGDARMREAYAAVTPRETSGDVIDRRWGVWASGYGGASTLNGNTAAGSSTTTSRIYGTVVGADYRVSPDTLVGFALGGAGFNFSVADSLGGGRADVFQAGLYARHNLGPAYLSAALAYGWQDVTTDRTVTVSGTDKLTANFKASTFAGRLEAGWRFAPIPASSFGVTPYAAVQATTFHLPFYGETALVGSNQFALSYSAQDTTNVRTELGVRTDQRFLLNDGVLTLRGRLAWAHDSNTNRLVNAAFQTLPGAAFTVSGAQPAADSALVGGRAEMKWRNGLSLAGTVEGEFSRSTQTYTGKGMVRYEW